MFQVNFYTNGYTKDVTTTDDVTMLLANLGSTGEVSARALRRLADRIPGGGTWVRIRQENLTLW